jgi:hypothetical protein
LVRDLVPAIRSHWASVVRAVVCALALALFAAPSAVAQERELEDAPPPSSIYEIEAPIDRSYPEPETRRSVFPWINRQRQSLPAFFADTHVYLRYRSYYLRQDRSSGRLSEAWAMGGSVYYHSGWLEDFFAAELEGFTSQPIIAHADRNGTRLLREPDPKGLSVLGVANGKLRYRDLVLTGYRQKLDLPYLNRQDNRMIPNSFEAAKLAWEGEPLRFAAGYTWKFKPRDDDDFDPLSHQLGVSKDRGAAFGTVLWDVSEDFSIGGSGFVVPDVLATVYAETHYDLPLTDSVGLRLDAQFTHQQTVGQQLFAGSPFDTWNFGLRTSASWRDAVVRLAFSITDDDHRIESPYGSNPAYINLMQRTFTQRDEKALLVSLSYDFSRLGIEGLSAIVNFAQSWDGVVAGARGDARTVDFTADYRVGRGWFDSLWLRLRASWIDVESAPQDGTDIRVILRYELPVI